MNLKCFAGKQSLTSNECLMTHCFRGLQDHNRAKKRSQNAAFDDYFAV
jgi:hypothetical protein